MSNCPRLHLLVDHIDQRKPIRLRLILKVLSRMELKVLSRMELLLNLSHQLAPMEEVGIYASVFNSSIKHSKIPLPPNIGLIYFDYVAGSSSKYIILGIIISAPLFMWLALSLTFINSNNQVNEEKRWISSSILYYYLTLVIFFVTITTVPATSEY